MEYNLTVTAIITAYNRPDYLKEAIESVLKQNYVISEIIIIDDCSIENLKDVVDSFKEKKIIYIKNKINSGANYCRNLGIQYARSNYIAFLDDDDIWDTDKTGIQIDCLVKNNLNISLCNYSKIGKNIKIKKSKKGIINEDQLKKGNLFCGASGILSSRKVMQENNFDESLPCGQDWDLFVRLIKNNKIYYIDSPLFQYRVSESNSITANAKKISINDYSYRLKAIEKHKVWLGKYYNSRISDYILTNLAKRDKIYPWIKFSIKKAGLVTTMYILAKKIVLKFF